MPKPPPTDDVDLDLERYALQEQTNFAAGFRRSKRGNLWRNFGGMTLTIFRRQGDDRYGWSISDNDGPRFSRHAYETEDDAMDDLCIELGIGEA